MEKLTDALRLLVKETFLGIFYGKKKQLNFLTTYYISYESGIKIFIK